MIGYLTCIAGACIVLSGGALFLLGIDAKEIITLTFAPVGIVVAGLVGFMQRESTKKETKEEEK